MLSKKDASTDGKEQRRGVWSRLVRFITSMRFTLGLLLIIGFFILLEAITPFNMLSESRIFTFLCLLLLLSLIICSALRFTSSLRSYQNGLTITSRDSILSQPLQNGMTTNKPPAQALSGVESLLKSQGFRLLRHNSELIYADHGRFGFFGSNILHLGLIVIIAGICIGAPAGFEGTVYLTGGQSFLETGTSYDNISEGWRNIFWGNHRGFETRLDDFQIDYSDDYHPTDFISRVTVLEASEAVLTRDITVNSPLSYRGVNIYQSTYGWALSVRIEEPSGEALLDDIIRCPMDTGGIGTASFTFPDMPVAMDFILVPDQQQKGGMRSTSPRPNNPVLFFVLRSGQTVMTRQDIPLGEKTDIGGLTVSFDRLEMYSGLMVTSSPEVPAIYSGFGIVIIGLILVFYITPRCFWVVAEPEETGASIMIRGNVGRKGDVFAADFARLTEEIKRYL